LSRHGLDAAVVVAAAVSVVGTATRDDASRPDGVELWLVSALVAAVVLVLLLRRRFPFTAPAALWVGSAALSFVDGRLVGSQPAIFLVGLVAAFLLGRLRSLSEAWAGLVIVLGSAAVIVSNVPDLDPVSLVSTPLQFGLAWVVGYALRERTERTEAAELRAHRAEQDRETAARIAVAEERARIARELHDVVAHAVSVMVLRVGAVRHRMAESDVENRDALKDVEEAGRAALAEMRRLLGAMRHADEEAELAPHPGLEELDHLVDEVRGTGLAVTLRQSGAPVDLPPALDLSAYRIVQEALTNTLKHAHARHATVDLRYGISDLEIEVGDDGRGPASQDGLGHGLVGIRERVKIYGGEMSAGPGPNGGFRVGVRLPIGGERS
jgi:signal transduction histidine kinase